MCVYDNVYATSSQLKHKLTHALGILPILAPSKRNKRAGAACFPRSGFLRLNGNSGR